jgi:hypothetical protein
MDPVTHLLKADPGMASSIAESLSKELDKPLIRCQNCTKTLEEIGEHAKFMVCSNCRSKLDFFMHYCSSYVFSTTHSDYILTCSRQGVPEGNHKKHCGKEKVVKKAPFTTSSGNILSQTPFVTYNPQTA